MKRPWPLLGAVRLIRPVTWLVPWLLILLAAAPALATSAREESRAYSSPGSIAPSACVPDPCGVRLFAPTLVAFEPRPDDAVFSIRIVDDDAEVVPAYYRMLAENEAGTWRIEGTFCGASRPVALIDGTYRLEVELRLPHLTCNGLASSGTIVASFDVAH